MDNNASTILPPVKKVENDGNNPAYSWPEVWTGDMAQEYRKHQSLEEHEVTDIVASMFHLLTFFITGIAGAYALWPTARQYAVHLIQ